MPAIVAYAVRKRWPICRVVPVPKVTPPSPAPVLVLAGADNIFSHSSLGKLARKDRQDEEPRVQGLGEAVALVIVEMMVLLGLILGLVVAVVAGTL